MVGFSKFNICELPKELLEKIFVFLNVDSVEAAEKVCTRWESLISTSINVWKSQIVQLCSLKSQYKRIISSKVYTDVKTDPANLKSLYYHMAKIEENMDNNEYDVIVIPLDWFEASNKQVSEVETLPFIDPVLIIRSDNRLVVSRFDTIQVWDLDTYQCMHVFHDCIQYNAKGWSRMITSLALHGDTIFSGYNNGRIKLFDLQTGKIVAKVRGNFKPITEMAVKDEVLVTLDNYGEIIVWNMFIQQPGQIVEIHAQVKLVRSRYFNPICTKYKLLAYSGDHLVTTCRQVDDDGFTHLIYYKNGRFVRSYPTESNVNCISIQGNSLAFGGSGNFGAMVGIFKLYQEGAPGILYLRIPKQGRITSLSFFDKFLILIGHLPLGQLHMVDISQIQFPPPGIKHEVELGFDNFGVKYIRSLPKNHDLMGAIGVDSYRMFIETRANDTIFVHDYMKYHNAQKVKNLDEANPKIVELITGRKEGITDGIFKRVKGSKYKLVAAAKKKKEPKAKKPIVKTNKKVLVRKTIKPAKKYSAKSVNKSKTKKVAKNPTKITRKMAAKKSAIKKVATKKPTTVKVAAKKSTIEKDAAKKSAT